MNDKPEIDLTALAAGSVHSSPKNNETNLELKQRWLTKCCRAVIVFDDLFYPNNVDHECHSFDENGSATFDTWDKNYGGEMQTEWTCSKCGNDISDQFTEKELKQYREFWEKCFEKQEKEKTPVIKLG